MLLFDHLHCWRTTCHLLIDVPMHRNLQSTEVCKKKSESGAVNWYVVVVVQGKSTAVRRCTTSATMAGVWCYSGSVMVKMTAGTTLMNFCVVCGSCRFCSVCQLICTKNIFDKSSFAGFLLLIKSHVAYGSIYLLATWRRRHSHLYRREAGTRFSDPERIQVWGDLVSCLHALVAVSTGMRAVKLCTNKILQFLTGGAGYVAQVALYNGCKMAVVVVYMPRWYTCWRRSPFPILTGLGIE